MGDLNWGGYFDICLALHFLFSPVIGWLFVRSSRRGKALKLILVAAYSFLSFWAWLVLGMAATW